MPLNDGVYAEALINKGHIVGNKFQELVTQVMDSVKKNIRYRVFNSAMVSAGMGIVVFGLVEYYHEMPIALGAASIIAGSVGAYMMFMTSHVVGLNDCINEQTGIHKEIEFIHKVIASTHKVIASTKKENHNEMISTQKEMASSQKENHREMMQILKKIDHTLENLEQKS